jgi:hypothetical protein
MLRHTIILNKLFMLRKGDNILHQTIEEKQ